MSVNNKILEIKNLTKTFYTEKDSIEAIRDISFDVYDGEFLSIVGSSGCGKSTLLNILADLEIKSGGTFKFNDKNSTVGYMLQTDSLFPWLSILDNCLLGLDIKKMKTKENIDYVKKLLNTYGLKDFIYKYPGDLSGGMRQRVALIRTLATKPSILLLDEPFCALDYVARLKVSEDVYNIIKKEKKTAILITHDIAESVSLSDRVIVLSKRPSVIKNIYKIDFKEKLSPIENRKSPLFKEYYDLIWKDLDDYVT